jgi:hypothetical protein
MDGGYALRIPVDAIAEFRILTQSAPSEFGGTGGATTSVVTRSGGNKLHGNIYEFVRNDAFDAKGYFAEKVEPLEQNQFGGTIGGPVKRDRAFFFGYYEGLRNRQGVTTSATVPTAAERRGDFSAMTTPLLNLAAGGVPFPGNQIPSAAINPVAQNVLNLYPLGNVSPSIYRETLVGTNSINQLGARIDVNGSTNDQFFARYSFSGGDNINPISVRGTDAPGFPTRDDLGTPCRHRVAQPDPVAVDDEHGQGLYLRHQFFLRSAANRTTPGELGFRIQLIERRGAGAAVLQRQRLHADWRRHHRPA